MPLSPNQLPDELNIPKDISGKEVLKNLSEMLSDKDQRDKVVKAILGKDEKRPVNWARSSNPPYYRERFALELKKHLDEMMQDQEDIIFRYEDFDWLTKTSLYLMINQAFKYLTDKLDPDGKYAAFRQIISITKHKDSHGNAKGVRFSIARDIRLGSPKFKATKIEDEREWHFDIETFIEESTQGQVYQNSKIVLTDAEIFDLETFLAMFPNIVYTITNNNVKIVKVG